MNKFKEGLVFGAGFSISVVIVSAVVMYMVMPIFDKAQIATPPQLTTKIDKPPVLQSEDIKTINHKSEVRVLSVNDFKREIIRPEWFNSILAPDINDPDAVSKLWQSKKRCCVDEKLLLANNREFYKACYNAIIHNPDDEELVVKCLWLMDAGADRDQRLKIKRYLINNFADHKNSTARCANCATADTVARVTHEVARNEKYDGNMEEAIRLIENLMDTRGRNVSLWIQTELYESLGNMYLSSSITDQRKNRLQQAYDKLDSVREFKDNGVYRRFEKFENAYRQVMAR